MVKFYSNGKIFYEENKNIIEQNIIETAFFKVNAKNIMGFDTNEYCIKITNDSEYLIALRKLPHNLLIFGSKSLCKKLAEIIFINNLKFDNVLCSNELYEEFSKHYLCLNGGSFKTVFDMNILISDNVLGDTVASVATLDDLEEICSLVKEFKGEVFNTNEEVLIKEIESTISDFRYLKTDNKIVSIARKTREENSVCSISMVYTRPEYRGKSFAKKVVTSLRNEIVNSGKTAYLYVDNNNKISSHLYESIGFRVLVRRLQTNYNIGNIRKAMFAGGCFWCIANNYYNLDGVIEVYSGYAGGNTFFPTYDQVKTGLTQHKESILIIYDNTKVKYYDLIKMFFENIDAFDGDGQFIDRGSSYQTCVFTSYDEEKECYHRIKNIIEEKYQKAIKVPLMSEAVFYLAEDEHQKFAIKNAERFKKEEEISGRNKFQGVKI